MPDVDSKDRVRQRRKQLRGWQVLVILALFFVTLLVAARGAIAWRYAQHLDAREAAGLPVDVPSYRQWQREADTERAMRLYRQAFDAADADEWNTAQRDRLIIAGFSDMPAHDEPLSDDQLNVAKQYLDDQSQAIALLHEAADAGGGMGPWRLDRYGTLTTLAELGDVRAAANRLAIEAVVAAEEGDAEAAVAAMEAASYVAATLEYEHFMIDLLVQTGVVALWLETAERVVARVELNEPLLVRLSESVQRLGGGAETFSRMLIGEDAYGLLLLEEEGPDAMEWGTLDRILGLGEMDEMYRAGRVQQLREIYNSSASEPERLDAFRQVANEPVPWWTNSALDVSLFNHAIEQHYHATVNKRAARVALAALRYRQATGQPPDGLHDLTPRFLPTLPMDPFSGESLIYNVHGDGFVVYSVGLNGGDDGGTRTDDQDTGDILFRVHRPR